MQTDLGSISHTRPYATENVASRVWSSMAKTSIRDSLIFSSEFVAYGAYGGVFESNLHTRQLVAYGRGAR